MRGKKGGSSIKFRVSLLGEMRVGRRGDLNYISTSVSIHIIEPKTSNYNPFRPNHSCLTSDTIIELKSVELEHTPTQYYMCVLMCVYMYIYKHSVCVLNNACKCSTL